MDILNWDINMTQTTTTVNKYLIPVVKAIELFDKEFFFLQDMEKKMLCKYKQDKKSGDLSFLQEIYLI